MPVLIWLLAWAIAGTPAVVTWNAWLIGLIVALVLSFNFGIVRKP